MPRPRDLFGLPVRLRTVDRLYSRRPPGRVVRKGCVRVYLCGWSSQELHQAGRRLARGGRMLHSLRGPDELLRGLTMTPSRAFEATLGAALLLGPLLTTGCGDGDDVGRDGGSDSDAGQTGDASMVATGPKYLRGTVYQCSGPGCPHGECTRPAS